MSTPGSLLSEMTNGQKPEDGGNVGDVAGGSSY